MKFIKEKESKKYIPFAYETNDKSDESNDDNPYKGINIRIIGTGNPESVDPAILNFLPPEIREALCGKKEVTNGSDGELPPEKKEQEEEVRVMEKIKYNFKMVNCNQNLKILTEKLKKSKTKK